MSDMIFDRDYEALLTSSMANTSTPGVEIEVLLNKSPQSNTGFLIIDQGDLVKEEILFYHRKSGSSVYVYGINRSNPVSHNINANVLLTNSIDGMNFLSENTFQQMYIYKKSDKELFVQGGKFYIDGVTVDISDLDTTLALTDKVLTVGDTNFISIKDGDYYISTTYDSGLYQIAEVSVNTSGVITNIGRNKVFSLSGKTLNQTEITKLSGIEDGAEVNVQSDYGESNLLLDSFIKNKPDLSVYETKSNKQTIIGNPGDNNNYPTTKAVRDELNLKVDKVAGKGLSENDYNAAAIAVIANKVDKVSGKELSENDFTDADKTKLDGLSNYAGIDFIAGSNVGISEVVDGSGHRDISISSITNVGIEGQSPVMMNIRPVQNGSNGAFYTYEEWDRYIVLKDKGYNGFDGKVSTPVAADDINKVRVYVKNSGIAGQLKLQLLIRVTDDLGIIIDKYNSIPFNVNIGSGDTFFDIPTSKLSGLTITNSNNIYFKIIRDASRSIESDKDTVNNRILISTATVYFNIPPSPFTQLYNCNILEDSITGTDDYVININNGCLLIDKLLVSYIPDINNTGPATLNYNSTGAKPIVRFDGSALQSNDIKGGTLFHLKYDLANDRWLLAYEFGAGVNADWNSSSGLSEILNKPDIVTKPTGYTITNNIVNRTLDANSITLNELADIVATLINDLNT